MLPYAFIDWCENYYKMKNRDRVMIPLGILSDDDIRRRKSRGIELGLHSQYLRKAVDSEGCG